MTSGVKVGDCCKAKFLQLSLTTQKQQKIVFFVMKFSDDMKKIIVERFGTLEDCGSYDNLITSLPIDDVRYVCFDFEYINKDNCRKSDILLISWHPDGSSVRKKMICASSFSALKSSLGISRNVLEGDCYSEVDSKAALEKVGGKALP
ncbi:unnamed protein product [Candidula unifasciata]|uniref:ADF-H domain-containing protein n=1 Tax=Candidula unifasciata TaxID=100452 RepID=A0A8S4A6R7_9EUPU|nr:unnamed protein product [Candidula unifasciata]